jgi:hypothetical protein
MIKFRTMRAGAEHQQDALETQNEASGPLFKIRDDPAWTRVGALLRALSLDEVPQALNVLRGEMSLVGRARCRSATTTCIEPWHASATSVLPGITGLWQISGRSELTFDDLVRLDFYYLENWSIWLDVSILRRRSRRSSGGEARTEHPPDRSRLRDRWPSVRAGAPRLPADARRLHRRRARARGRAHTSWTSARAPASSRGSSSRAASA